MIHPSDLSLRLLGPIRIRLVFRHKLVFLCHFTQKHLTNPDPILAIRTTEQILQFASTPVGWWAFVHLCGETFEESDGDVAVLEGEGFE
jgi:hypothetical protein